jgi:hypothetical protein
MRKSDRPKVRGLARRSYQNSGSDKLLTARVTNCGKNKKWSKVTINRFFSTTSIFSVSRAGWLDVIETFGNHGVGPHIRCF